MSATETSRDFTVESASRVFCDAAAYADEPYWHAATEYLRREHPVPYVDIEGFPKFWAATRYDDVMDIERNVNGWLATMRPALGPDYGGGDEIETPIRTLVQMDPPDHTQYRKISADWFKPARIAMLGDRAAQLAKRSVDHMAELGNECDFFRDVAMDFPLYMILSLLGLPEEDFPRMLKLTQEMFGSSDPELQRQGDDAADPMATMLEFFEYFQGLVDDRRANPRDDLASVIANAEIDGELIGLMEVIGYYVIIATAGHDTTSSAIGGAMAALLANPDQLDLLRKDPELVGTATEEFFRYVTPVKQFVRTAKEDQVVGGVTIPEGGRVLLSYPSANRDEAVFDDPQRFDITRNPNRHIARSASGRTTASARTWRRLGPARSTTSWSRASSTSTGGRGCVHARAVRGRPPSACR
ncbi:MAG: cytochrome P450 [Acidimicrobiia bacterium]